MAGEIAALVDRGVIEVSGPEARPFLQRLITNDVEALGDGEARYAALLTPQGKIISDFLVVAAGDALLLDAPLATAADLARRLTLYRLRAKVTVADRTETLGVVAYPHVLPEGSVVRAYRDPRSAALWGRAIVQRDALPAGDPDAVAACEAARVAAGVPAGGVDFAFGDTFPHEANLDRLHGVDFRKGCYVGQEVVSRVEHRGTARKRIVRFAIGKAVPAPGSAVMAGDLAIGTIGSSARGFGLGLVRTDRLEEALAGGAAIMADGVELRPDAAA